VEVRRAAGLQRQLCLGAALHPPPGAHRPGRLRAGQRLDVDHQSGEGEIRKAIIEADLVDCMVALPGQLFYSTQIPVCLWFIARDKRAGTGTRPYRDRRGETLFIDARKLGTMIDRTHRELTDEDIARIAGTYHAWRSDKVGAGLVPAQDQGDHKGRPYEDVPGFCRAATLNDLRAHNHILTPGRYVGAAEVEDDGEPFEEKMERLTAELRDQMAQAAKLDGLLWANLEEIGYGK
jgi:type I restriction enzyme M protein